MSIVEIVAGLFLYIMVSAVILYSISAEGRRSPLDLLKALGALILFAGMSIWGFIIAPLLALGLIWLLIRVLHWAWTTPL